MVEAAGGHREIGQWDRYWSYGSLHSFSQVMGGNYAGAIADFWREQFADLAPGAHVVDIATGNGAIALLALEAADAAGIGIEVSGVDLARIEPLQRVQDEALRARLERVRFHPRTPAESLPFADASVALACSQFGLEYAGPGAVDELARVCRKGGRLALIVHHAESLPLAATADEIAQLDFVLDEVGLYRHARDALRALADARGRGGPRIERRRRALNEALQRIATAASERDHPRMLLGPANYVREVFAALDRQPPRRLLELLEETRQRVLANRQRLRDMRVAAQDDAANRQLGERLANAGFALDRREPFHEHDGTLLGWCLTASRE